MIHPSLIPILGLLGTATASAAPDVLRLADGELAGKFAGISPGGMIRWERMDSPAPLEFKIDKVRHVALAGGIPRKPDKETSHVELLNGDRIAGRITSLRDGHLTLESPQAGPLVIPVEKVRRLAPNPFGGRLIYAGPFSPEGWEIVPSNPVAGAQAAPESGERNSGSSWEHVAAHWYYTGGSDALRYPAGMPSNSILRFHMDWRSRPAISIAIHADFAKAPEPKEDEDGDGEIERPDLAARVFGNALVVSIRANYATLQHCGFTKEGKPFMRHLRSSSSSVRIEESGGADFELRTNLKDGTVALHVDGAFWLQWNVDFTEDSSPLGGGIGFLINGEEQKYRITDVLVAEWNGMPDAARSFESPDRDVLLMNNGTDRFSGEVKSIADGSIRLKGPYGEFEIPMTEVADVHFTRGAEAEDQDEEDASEGEGVRVHFLPVGRIHGRLVEATPELLILESPVVGRIETRLESASLLEFSRQGLFLQGWDDDF